MGSLNGVGCNQDLRRRDNVDRNMDVLALREARQKGEGEEFFWRQFVKAIWKSVIEQ